MNTTAKIALVTGANKGIGRAVARQLAERGVVVLLGARDKARGETAAAELAASGDVRHVHLDVTDETTITAAAEQVRDEFGRLDILVNNAGIADWTQPPSAVPVDAVRRVYDVNVFGVIAVTNAFLPLLREAPAARIVNLSTPLGSLSFMSDPEAVRRVGAPQLLAYNSSKTALNAVTLAYANELAGTPIKVNLANPGYVATDMNDHRGVLSPDEGARIVVDLAMLPEDGPNGAFLSADGPIGW